MAPVLSGWRSILNLSRVMDEFRLYYFVPSIVPNLFHAATHRWGIPNFYGSTHGCGTNVSELENGVTVTIIIGIYLVCLGLVVRVNTFFHSYLINSSLHSTSLAYDASNDVDLMLKFCIYISFGLGNSFPSSALLWEWGKAWL